MPIFSKLIIVYFLELSDDHVIQLKQEVTWTYEIIKQNNEYLINQQGPSLSNKINKSTAAIV